MTEKKTTTGKRLHSSNQVKGQTKESQERRGWGQGRRNHAAIIVVLTTAGVPVHR